MAILVSNFPRCGALRIHAVADSTVTCKQFLPLDDLVPRVPAFDDFISIAGIDDADRSRHAALPETA